MSVKNPEKRRVFAASERSGIHGNGFKSTFVVRVRDVPSYYYGWGVTDKDVRRTTTAADSPVYRDLTYLPATGSAPRASILGNNRPSNDITTSPSAHTVPNHQPLPSLPRSNLPLPSPALGEVRDGRRTRDPESFATIRHDTRGQRDRTPSAPLWPTGRGYRRGHGLVRRLLFGLGIVRLQRVPDAAAEGPSIATSRVRRF